MADQPDIPTTPATKPKFSRWGIACIIFSLIGFLYAVICLWELNFHQYCTRKPGNTVSKLYLAIKQYETVYGRLPAAEGPVRDYDRLIAILAAQSPENTRKISFLNPNTDKNGRPEFKDRWDSDFMVVFSSSGTIQAGTGGIGKTVYSNVAVWSKGANRIDDHGEYDQDSHPPKDDISFW